MVQAREMILVVDLDDGKNGLLYDKLLEIVRDRLQAQREYLKKPINKLEDTVATERKSNDDSKEAQNDTIKTINTTATVDVSDEERNYKAWKLLLNFEEIMLVDRDIGVRQDSCIDIKSGKELLPFPIKPTFSGKTLKAIERGLILAGTDKRYGNDQVNKNVNNDFDFLNSCDTKSYLTQLMVVAHQLNHKFQ